MSFLTAYETREDRMFCPSGDGKVKIYELVDGKVIQTGEHDLYHDIQLAKAMCYDIDALIGEMIETGDSSVLNLRNAYYMDTTAVPDDPAAARVWAAEMIEKAKAILDEAQVNEEPDADPAVKKEGNNDEK